MKKLVTLLLTAALAVTAATTAFADTKIEPNEDGSPNPTSKQIDVTYTAKPIYTVTIPANIALTSQTDGTAKGTAKVSAANVIVPHGQSVKVALSTDFQVALKLASGSTTSAPTLKYKVMKGTDEVQNNGVVLEVVPEVKGKSGDADLVFVTDPVVYSGAYEGTVTFTVSVGDKTPTT